MTKIRKKEKENEKKERPKASTDTEWMTRRRGVWSVECGGTTIRLGATTKK